MVAPLASNLPKAKTKGEVESERDSKHSYNFWDTEFIKETGQIIGEDFAFCKRFRDIGGRIYALVDSEIAHHGNYPFRGRFIDECGKIE